MTSPRSLVGTNCWQVSGVSDASAFFRAIPALVPQATHMFLEGTPARGIVAIISADLDAIPYCAPVWTLWSWPRNGRFAVRTSPPMFARLGDAAEHHAQPEVCDHLHFYRNEEPLVQWFDAFHDPLWISKAIPRERVQMFCSELGGVLSDGAV
jgi:hypothetical protein